MSYVDLHLHLLPGVDDGAADDAAAPAQAFGKGHPQDRTRLPVGRSARRRGAFDPLDRQAEILHPWRKHIAKDTPGLLDTEVPGLLPMLHDGDSPPGCRWAFLSRWAEMDTRPARLENARLEVL